MLKTKASVCMLHVWVCVRMCVRVCMYMHTCLHTCFRSNLEPLLLTRDSPTEPRPSLLLCSIINEVETVDGEGDRWERPLIHGPERMGF